MPSTRNGEAILVEKIGDGSSNNFNTVTLLFLIFYCVGRQQQVLRMYQRAKLKKQLIYYHSCLRLL